MIPQLTVAASATVNYTWAPTKEGVYNITTYAQPVSGETSVVNNVLSFFTSATYKLALISDGSSVSLQCKIIGKYSITSGYLTISTRAIILVITIIRLTFLYSRTIKL